MKKILCVFFALAILSNVAYAVVTPVANNQKNAVDNSNLGREHIDIFVRNYMDVNISPELTGTNNQHASEGTVVIWATQSEAIIGRDVTFINKADAPLVAGIIVESGGIASGEYGRMRIYGYFDDVLAADSTDPVSQSVSLGTSTVFGQVGGRDVASSSSVGVCFDAGSGSDGAEVQVMINVCN